MPSQLDTASMVALVSITSLVIDRIVNAVLLLFSFSKRFPDPQLAETPAARAVAEKKLRVLSWIGAAGLAALVVILFEPIRILATLGLNPKPLLDGVLTTITLAGGADLVRSILSVKGAPEAPPESPKPLEVTGRLILEEGERKARGQAA